jgi:hypothetical protein
MKDNIVKYKVTYIFLFFFEREGVLLAGCMKNIFGAYLKQMSHIFFFFFFF